MSAQNPVERLVRWLMVLIIGAMTALVFLNVVLRIAAKVFTDDGLYGLGDTTHTVDFSAATRSDS